VSLPSSSGALCGLVLAAVLCALPLTCTLDRRGGLALDAGGSTPTGGGGVGGSGAGAGGIVTTGGAGGVGGGTGGTTSTSGTAGEGGVGGGVDPVCGNGDIEGQEACDDQNILAFDGCYECQIEAGFTCDGEPSVCQPIDPQITSEGPGLNVSIYDGDTQGQAYDGAINTMACVDLALGNVGFHAIQDVEVTVGIDHNFLGDLIIKLFSPQGTETTLMNRPGVAEPVDAFYEPSGDSSNLTGSHPVTFRDDASDSPESMGNTIGTSEEACKDDGRCDYLTSPGAGPGSSLADFNGEDPVGTWKLCVADGDDGDSGSIDSVTLSVLAW